LAGGVGVGHEVEADSLEPLDEVREGDLPHRQQLERVLDHGLLVVVDRVLGLVDVLALGARRVLDRLELLGGDPRRP
jgi:hypothetical protein